MRRSIVLLLFFVLLAPAAAEARNATGLLSEIPVRVENNTGYKRDLFRHWLDLDGNSCDTRDEVLLRQDLSARPRCRSSRGGWFSAYDGLRFTEPSRLDIDHFVPLAEAWGSGAWDWKADSRDRFANDLYGYSLLAVSASSNRSKSDRDPAEWMPPRSSYRCTYLARWVAVKYRWRLSVDVRERDFLLRGLGACPKAAVDVKQITRARVETSGTPQPPPPGELDPRFSSCTEAKAAGYGPYYRDIDPEYLWYRDGDGDGIACE